jgi:hypothetical protein
MKVGNKNISCHSLHTWIGRQTRMKMNVGCNRPLQSKEQLKKKVCTIMVQQTTFVVVVFFCFTNRRMHVL